MFQLKDIRYLWLAFSLVGCIMPNIASNTPFYDDPYASSYYETPTPPPTVPDPSPTPTPPSPANFLVTTFVGNNSGGFANGQGDSARFYFPSGLTVDPSGNLYVADRSNACIRKVTPDGGVSTFAGVAGTTGSLDGPATVARFVDPNGIALGPNNYLYVSDQHCIRKIGPDGVVTTIAGSTLSDRRFRRRVCYTLQA
jgi:hypothetical protein